MAKRRKAPDYLFAHVGDVHLTSGARFAKTATVMDWIVDDALALGVKDFGVGGDLFGLTIPHRATPEEKLTMGRWLTRMPRAYLVEGNHDYPLDLALFELLDTEVVYSGRSQIRSWRPRETKVSFVLAPYPFKALWVGDDVPESIEEQNALAATRYYEALRRVVEIEVEDKRTVVVLGHFNVAGSMVGGGEILSGHEVELTIEQLEALPVAAILLSHIHKAQTLGTKIHYAGSPTAQSFGEQADRKCYLLCRVYGSEVEVERRYTPAPILWTMDATYDGTWTVGWPIDDDWMEGSECRLRVTVPEHLAATAYTTEIETELALKGVEKVVVEVKVVPQVMVRSEAISGAYSDQSRLDIWARLQDPPIDDAQLNRLHRCLLELGG